MGGAARVGCATLMRGGGQGLASVLFCVCGGTANHKNILIDCARPTL
jgi:hypothetical protein